MHTTLLLTVLHLASWAQLGVVARVYVGRLFGCPPEGGAWIPCVTSAGTVRYGGALFTDLPANVLGSLAIGFLTPTSVLAVAVPSAMPAAAGGTVASPLGAQLAFLTPASPLQAYAPLHLGLRTGFCGSLTTYASWMLQLVVMTVGLPDAGLGTQWVEALWGAFIGTAVALASLVMGQHLAAGIGRCVLARQAAATAKRKLQPAEMQPLPEQPEPQADADEPAPVAGKAPPPSVAAMPHVAVGVLGPQPATAEHRPASLLVADALAAINLCVLTALALVGVIGDGSGVQGGKELWFAVLFGPAGCLLRWQLAQLNGKLGGSWEWFPAGTFLANQAACALDFGLDALRLRVPGLSELHVDVLMGFMSGLAGCLSTVSTWAAEVRDGAAGQRACLCTAHMCACTWLNNSSVAHSPMPTCACLRGVTTQGRRRGTGGQCSSCCMFANQPWGQRMSHVWVPGSKATMCVPTDAGSSRFATVANTPSWPPHARSPPMAHTCRYRGWRWCGPAGHTTMHWQASSCQALWGC